ncbi:hypothetical protein Nepgr_025270 [Nepenthes gracilis]|uniref:Uncharacterized protein n=1 Tax=Nepenthes gracilis TaxID=150966 RepID=A0AAD3XZD2_NEPGR|nr:hypothetical protein Nepgr_025270 [Nepenthes gracilis]
MATLRTKLTASALLLLFLMSGFPAALASPANVRRLLRDSVWKMDLNQTGQCFERENSVQNSLTKPRRFERRLILSSPPPPPPPQHSRVPSPSPPP